MSNQESVDVGKEAAARGKLSPESSSGPSAPGSDGPGSVVRRGLSNEAVPAEGIKRRRRFTPAYKRRILDQLAACTVPGEIGELLRREGLYHSHVNTFRRQLEAGSLAEGASLQKKQASHERAMAKQKDNRVLERLERENIRLRMIIDVQKKLCELLSLPTEEVPPPGEYRTVSLRRGRD